MYFSQILHVLAAMQRGQCPVRHVGEEGQVVAIEVKVQNVELPRAGTDFGQHGEMGGNVPGQFLVEPQRNLPAADEPRISLAVAAGKESYVVTARHERIGEMKSPHAQCRRRA